MNSRLRERRRIGWLVLAAFCFAGAIAGASKGSETATNPPVPPPETPREYFNAGTLKLREGKLREAETDLRTAIASQNARLQPPALYNLGHVRAAQGLEELKKGPAARPTAGRGRAAAREGEAAVRQADAALAGQDVQEMVAAYIRGRGARHELHAATRAVIRAMESYGTALIRWRRASGDFKSAVELNPADTNAQHNGDVMDRAIAQLVDKLQMLQQVAMMMREQNRQLGQRLKKLRGRIPASMMPPGAAGDDEEDDDMPFGPRPGQREGATREGNEMHLSPEEAERLLDGFKLDGNRRLPMGEREQSPPNDHKGRNW